MSRYCGNKDPTLILEAASHWKQIALLGDGSVFTDGHIWTTESIEALDRYFVKTPDESDRGFMEKLQGQLSATTPVAKQLAAEMLWLMYLCPSSLTARHKRETIKEIWSWSNAPFPESTPWMTDDVLDGIGSAGPGFNQNQWRELSYLIGFTQSFRRLPIPERQRLLADGWALADWLRQIRDSANRQLRHMLLYLLFPDDFERIFGQRDRRTIAIAFSGQDARSINRIDPADLDRLLSDTRKQLELQYKTKDLDYYNQPLRERWKPDSLSEVGQTISREHVQQAIAEIDRNGVPANAESTGYDLIEGGRRYPPKYVLSFAARHAGGEELDRGSFTGGDSSTAFRLLRDLGFDIESKSAIPDLVSRFLEQARAASELGTQAYLDSYRGLHVTVSFGKGNFARIPWIAFLAEGQAVSDGIYPVLLFFREQNVLLLCYGLSETKEPSLSWGNLGARATVKEWFQEHLGRVPDRYGTSYVRVGYDLAKALSLPDLNRELDEVIDHYRKVMANEPIAPPAEPEDDALPATPLESRSDLSEIAREFSEALRRSFVLFGSSHEDLVRAFVASLATKPLAGR